MEPLRRYTLITGASRGIGEAMAYYCASKNMNLILVARSGEKIEEIAAKIESEYHVSVKYFQADLTEAGTVAELYNWCEAQDFVVDILINNAGIGAYGRFDGLSMEEQLNVLDLNVQATIKMTYKFLPMLKEQSKSYIMNVASTACYQPIPYMSIYAATQSFIQSFTLGIREEFKHYNIMVSCLCPGPTATDFFERSGLSGLPVNSKEIKMPADEVAETAIEGMLDNVAEIIPGISNTLGAYFSKLLPNSWIVKAVSGLFKPRTTTAV